MKFTETALAGVWIVDLERKDDDRGWFARTWCREEFQSRGLSTDLDQCSLSFNRRAGTLRGMHYQAAPHQEAKLVRCVRGKMYDVALDLRAESLTHRQWFATELSPENGRALLIPKGCAHGFQTLADETEVFYQISGSFHPESAAGVRWNDPAFGISWPLALPTLSARDAAYPDFSPSQAG